MFTPLLSLGLVARSLSAPCLSVDCDVADDLGLMVQASESATDFHPLGAYTEAE